MRLRAIALALFVALVAFLIPTTGQQPADASGEDIKIGRVHENFQPNNGKVFVLIIGNDARRGNSNMSNADAIHIAGINTKTMKGGILNFPRDSWVSLPGYGTGRINEALVRGGPEKLAQAMESLTGIRIDYWVMVGFEGFQNVIREIGPVEVRVPRAQFDPYGSGARLNAGKQPLGAVKALQFVRTRKVLPDGDLDRTHNQGIFLLGMLRKLHGDVGRSPSRLLKWMQSARTHARMDLSMEDMYRLGILLTQVKPSNIGNVTVPARLGTAGAASVVFIQPGANDLYRKFRKTGSL